MEQGHLEKRRERFTQAFSTLEIINLTSHAYNKILAQEIGAAIPEYYVLINEIYTKMFKNSHA